MAKKYKTQSDKLQKLLTEHQINFTAIFTAPTSAIDPSAPSTAPASMETDEKKKLESSLAENIKMIEDLTKQLADLQAKYDADLKSYTEKESRFKQETLSRSTEAEKKLLGVNKEIEDLRSELSIEKVLSTEHFWQLYVLLLFLTSFCIFLLTGKQRGKKQAAKNGKI